MGDFERTFGAGADAVSIVDGYAREREKELYGGGSRTTQVALETRSLEGDTDFADLGSGLKLVKKASIATFYDEAVDLDRNERLHGNYAIFNPNVPMSPSEAMEGLEGALLFALRDTYDITQALIVVMDGGVRHLLGLEPQSRQLSYVLFNAFKSYKWTIGTTYSEFGWGH